ncbi:MAG: hypothetical protein IT381_11035 [Deltaproteobacteria bacterium]|nr:hypothetical protein [Deltaproteobacteria bacterium]
MLFAATFSLLLLGAESEGERVYGAPIVPNARKIEDARYVSPRNYDDTIEFYEKLYKGSGAIRFRAIINAPSVKAVHLQNLKPTPGNWVGINIYEINNQTRLFVVRGDGAKAEPKKK